MGVSKPIYIRIKDEDVLYQQCKLRMTRFEVGCWGYLITKSEEIATIYGISIDQIRKMLHLYDHAQEKGQHLCLVAGFPCVIEKKYFEIVEPPKCLSFPVPWEIII